MNLTKNSIKSNTVFPETLHIQLTWAFWGALKSWGLFEGFSLQYSRSHKFFLYLRTRQRQI